MFLRKLTVIFVPLAMLLFLCLIMPLLFSCTWYFGGLFIGVILGVLLGLLLPLAGATRYREPFAWLLFIPATVVLLILLYQYLASVGAGSTIPVLRLLVVPADYHGSLYVAVESAFAAYMLAFSIRTGRGI
ncbi:MAG: hypothetical protein K6E17_02145 [Clostridiales bacterium]|nr:hypothetical protein [Clostridiales bacterium]